MLVVVKMHKFTSTDAFIAFDLDDAPAVGVTRLARKVLADGAVLLARDTTYAFASFGLQRGGASAGVNAEGDGRDPAVEAFVAEATELVADGRWATDPGLGLSAEDLAPLYAVDPRPADLWSNGLADELTVKGAIAAAEAVLDGDLASTSATVVGTGAVADTARDLLTGLGTALAGDTVDTECDVIFVAGKAGVIDHDDAATMHARVIVPLSPAPLTARAHAVAAHAGRVHVPSFVSTAAPLLAGFDPSGGDPVERVRATVAVTAGTDSEMWMAMAERAEEYLRTWRSDIPTFRPLA